MEAVCLRNRMSDWEKPVWVLGLSPAVPWASRSCFFLLFYMEGLEDIGHLLLRCHLGGYERQAEHVFYHAHVVE